MNIYYQLSDSWLLFCIKLHDLRMLVSLLPCRPSLLPNDHSSQNSLVHHLPAKVPHLMHAVLHLLCAVLQSINQLVNPSIQTTNCLFSHSKTCLLSVCSAQSLINFIHPCFQLPVYIYLCS